MLQNQSIIFRGFCCLVFANGQVQVEIFWLLFPDTGTFSHRCQNICFWNNKIGRKLLIKPVLCLASYKAIFNSNIATRFLQETLLQLNCPDLGSCEQTVKSFQSIQQLCPSSAWGFLAQGQCRTKARGLGRAETSCLGIWSAGAAGVTLWVLLPACVSPRFYCYLEYPSLFCHSETTTPNLNNKCNFLILHSLSTSTDLVLKRHYHKTTFCLVPEKVSN